jgi:transposase-like protein
MSTVSAIYRLDNPDFSSLTPGQRRCLRCKKQGVYCHGFYKRLSPAENFAVGLVKAKVLVARYWCAHCRHTFSILPRPLVRRLRISLPMLIFLSLSTKTWDTVEGIFNISRSTLARWLRVARMLSAKLPEILLTLGITWMSLSQRISLLQYPTVKQEAIPQFPKLSPGSEMHILGV